MSDGYSTGESLLVPPLPSLESVLIPARILDRLTTTGRTGPNEVSGTYEIRSSPAGAGDR
jgi:hypothetical protein